MHRGAKFVAVGLVAVLSLNAPLPAASGSGALQCGFDSIASAPYAASNLEIAPSAFTFESTSSDVGWQVTTARSVVPGNGPTPVDTQALWYANASQGNYESGPNGDQHSSGDATSPVEHIASGSQVSNELFFSSLYEIESSAPDVNDQMVVQTSLDGGATWATLCTLNPTTTPHGTIDQTVCSDASSHDGAYPCPAVEGVTVPRWENRSAPLPSYYVGRDVMVRFRFDTIDGYANSGVGWMVTDVRLDPALNLPPLPAAPTLPNPSIVITSASGWNAKGSHEPDTTFDATGGKMWATPDTTPCTSSGCSSNMVYFNGFMGDCSAVCSSINPNTAANPALRTGFESPQRLHLAMLGVWKDCNNDGFVGLGDQGLWEYRSTLLLNTAICPPSPFNPTVWGPMPHNDGQWVHEFVPIEWGTTTYNDNTYHDNGSMVWWDNGLPTDDITNTPGSECFILPPARGTFHDAGGLVRYTDCLEGYKATDAFDGIADSNAALSRFSFSDQPRDQQESASALNMEPWGEQGDSSYLQAWNCGSPLVSQQVGQQNVELNPPRVPPGISANVPTIHPTGQGAIVGTNGYSIAGTANATASGFDQCYRRTDQGGGTGGAIASAPYAAEGDVTQPGVAKTSTNVMHPNVAPRGGPLSPTLGPGTPNDLGVPASPMTSPLGASRTGFWDDSMDEVGAVPSIGSTYVTYYAFISNGAISAYNLWLPGGNPGVMPSLSSYGQEACGGNTNGIYRGWDCDDTHWWLDGSGTDISPRSPLIGPDPYGDACTQDDSTPIDTSAASRGCMDVAPYPGSPYDLRDVDCLDSSAQPLRQGGITPATVYNEGAGHALTLAAPSEFTGAAGSCQETS